MNRYYFAKGAYLVVFSAPGGEMLFDLHVFGDGGKCGKRIAAILRREMQKRNVSECFGPVSGKGFAYLDGLNTAEKRNTCAALEAAGFTPRETTVIYDVPRKALEKFADADQRVRERFGIRVTRFYPYRNRSDAEKYYLVARSVAPVEKNSLFRALSAFGRGFRRGACLLAEDRGRPCGALLVSKEKNVYTARTLVVSEAARRRGTAAALIAAAACLPAESIRTGGITETNRQSRALAENIGCAEISKNIVYSLKLNKN